MKAKRKFNGFDLVLIIVVVALVVGVVVKFGILDGGATETADDGDYSVTYTLSVSPVRSYSIDALQVGDTLYYSYSDEDTVMGEITDIEVVPATLTYTTTEGEVLTLTYEDRYEMILTISSTCQASDSYGSSYAVNEITLLENRTDSYHTKYLSFSATMLSFEVEE